MLALLFLRRRDRDLIRDLVLISLLGIVISPVSWTHHYVIALLPFVYLWAKLPAARSRTLLVLFLAVATDFVAILQFAPTSHLFQLVLAAIVPSLTGSVAFLALAKDRQPSAQPVAQAAAIA